MSRPTLIPTHEIVGSHINNSEVDIDPMSPELRSHFDLLKSLLNCEHNSQHSHYETFQEDEQSDTMSESDTLSSLDKPTTIDTEREQRKFEIAVAAATTAQNEIDHLVNGIAELEYFLCERIEPCSINRTPGHQELHIPSEDQIRLSTSNAIAPDDCFDPSQKKV